MCGFDLLTPEQTSLIADSTSFSLVESIRVRGVSRSLKLLIDSVRDKHVVFLNTTFFVRRVVCVQFLLKNETFFTAVLPRHGAKGSALSSSSSD